jgi:hypothetical protein
MKSKKTSIMVLNTNSPITEVNLDNKIHDGPLVKFNTDSAMSEETILNFNNIVVFQNSVKSSEGINNLVSSRGPTDSQNHVNLIY